MSKSQSGAYHHAHRCLRLWLVFIGLSMYPTQAGVVKLKSRTRPANVKRFLTSATCRTYVKGKSLIGTELL